MWKSESDDFSMMDSTNSLRDRWPFQYQDIDSRMEEEPMSTNGEYYGSPDSSMKQSAREQKRRPKPKDGSLLVCGVCGDKALGYNFDAITCESCKAFFRRNALKTKVFTCSFDGNCKLDTHTRKFCSGCRLKKCFDIGMRKDWILSDEQLAKRKTTTKPEKSVCITHKNKQRKMEDSPGSTEDVSTTYMSEDSNKSPMDDLSPLKSDLEDEDYIVPLNEEYRKEIENLETQYKIVFDSGYTEEQVQKLTGDPRSPDELFNMTDIFIRRLIKFAKHIPEFRALPQEDQIHLLKGGIMEIMVLRSAMGFDSCAMQWKVKTNQQEGEKRLDPTVIQKNLGTGMYVEHVKFIRSLNEITRANKTIMTLLFVIELFSSDRPNLINKDLVSKGQEKFSTWLRAYLESQIPVGEAKIIYPKLLMKLLDVRSLGESSAQLASHLDITRLEPLLVEVFNLQK
ncbi:vitamin D3 receptor-like isoform X2 [Mytilus galloprovincialis]|uniref:vitamin D3 receptor-like isoform X2 n=2 Tax=Mytilus galloprovincialis TaxID=29158 RepID=UPI003F7CC983